MCNKLQTGSVLIQGEWVYQASTSWSGVSRKPMFSSPKFLGREPDISGTHARPQTHCLSAVSEAATMRVGDQAVQRPAFIQKYPLSLSETEFIDAILKTMLQESGVDLTDQRNAYIADYNTNAVAVGSRKTDFKNAEFNRAFVLMQYFGYLRRDPDQSRYQFWQNNLNNEPNNFRGMVCAFITSAEYQDRFSQVVTRNDRICGAAVQ